MPFNFVPLLSEFYLDSGLRPDSEQTGLGTQRRWASGTFLSQYIYKVIKYQLILTEEKYINKAVCIYECSYLQAITNLSESDCSQSESQRDCLETACLPAGGRCTLSSCNRKVEGVACLVTATTCSQWSCVDVQSQATRQFLLVVMRLSPYSICTPVWLSHKQPQSPGESKYILILDTETNSSSDPVWTSQLSWIMAHLDFCSASMESLWHHLCKLLMLFPALWVGCQLWLEN